jgi:molybdenum cofactor biosynthesis protein B
MPSSRAFVPLKIALLTIFDSRGPAEDRSGDLLAARLGEAGHALAARELVPDDRYRIRAVLSSWIADEGVEAVITTGGTGITGRDGTPEAVRPLLDKEIEGFGELFRVLSYEGIGTSTLQSRALAGVANATFVFCLPGSTGACADGWDKLIRDQLDHRTAPCNLAMLMPRLREA